MPTPKPSLGDTLDPLHPLSVGLVALYPFVDGSGSTQLTDFSGNGHHGVLTSLPADPWSTERGGSISFDTVGFVELGNIGSTLFSGDFTVVAEIFQDEPSVQSQFIFTKESAVNLGLAIFTQSPPDVFECRGGGQSGVLQTANNSVIVRTWHRIILTRTGSTLSYYVDSNLSGTPVTFTADASSGLSSARIGSTLWSGLLRWRGKISDVRVYSRGFTSSDVLSDFNDPWALIPNAVPIVIVTPPPNISGTPESFATLISSLDTTNLLSQNLIALLPFLDRSGSQVTDVSGNGNHATLSGLDASPWLTEQNGAIQFNGSGIGDLGNVSSSLFSGDFTVIANIYVPAGAIFSEFIIGKELTSSSGLSLSTLAGSEVFEGRIDSQSSPGFIQSNANSVKAGSWVRVLMTRSGASVSLYLDGVLSNSNTNASVFDGSSTSSLYLGGVFWSALLRFKGRMSDFRLYDRAFTVEEAKLDFDDPWSLFVPTLDFQAIIGGLSVTSFINFSDPFNITEDVTAIPVVNFSLHSRLSDIFTLTLPTAYQEVTVILRGVVVFGGIITVVTPRRESQVVNNYEITAVGYFKTLDYVDVFREDFISRTAGFILRSLVGKYAPWLVAGVLTVQEGPVLSQLVIRNRKLSDILFELAKDSGFVIFVDPIKQVIFKPKDQHRSSLLITDAATTYIPSTLELSPDFSRVFNVVKVVGGLQKGSSVTENLVGNGTANFNLIFPVYGVDKATLLFEDFSGSSFTGNLSETDVPNPSPPPNHVSSDGYIFPEFNKLQVVGGSGILGGVSLQSVQTFALKEFREFNVEEIFITAVSEGVVGPLMDGTGTGILDIIAGVYFRSSGEIDVIIEGVPVVLTDYKNKSGVLTGVNPTYQINQTYSVMAHVYKTGTETGVIPWGLRLYIQGGTAPNYEPVGGRDWSLLHEHTFTSDPQEFVKFAGILSKDAQFVIQSMRITDTVPVTVSVVGASKNVGLETDVGTKSDCFVDIGSNPHRLRFYTDTIPANGEAIVVTYNRAEETVIRRRNETSIARIKAFSGLKDDIGERHTTITPDFEAKTVSDLIKVAGNYLIEFSVEKLSGGVETFTPLLNNPTDPPLLGQLLNINLPSVNLGPIDVVISQIVQTVVTSAYDDSNQVVGPVIHYQISFTDVDSYVDFLLKNQQDRRTILKEVSNNQFIDLVDVQSSVTLDSSVLVITRFPQANAVVGEALVGVSDVGEGSA